MLPSYPTPWSALLRVQQIDFAARRDADIVSDGEG